MMRRISILFAFAVAIALTAASEPSTSFKKAPSGSALWSNPYAGQTEAVAAGRKLFRNECAQCHGADAIGGPSAPSLRSRKVQEAPAGVLFWFLTNGDLKHGMPSWSRLPEQRRWQIVTYLKSL